MDDANSSAAVQVAIAGDGTLTYRVGVAPDALPPVRRRDLEAAWDAARAGAIAEDWGPARLFRFRRKDGSHADLALADPDACCWAAAVDLTVGMRSLYGLSLCLRLLALVDLLGRARWAVHLFAVARDGARIHPRVLEAAAHLALTSEAGFDETGFRTAVADTALPAPASPFTPAARIARLAPGASP